MGKELFEFFAAQGIFTLLFCYLLLYVLKENNKREVKYQDLIFKMSTSILTIENDIKEIKKNF